MNTFLQNVLLYLKSANNRQLSKHTTKYIQFIIVFRRHLFYYATTNTVIAITLKWCWNKLKIIKQTNKKWKLKDEKSDEIESNFAWHLFLHLFSVFNLTFSLFIYGDIELNSFDTFINKSKLMNHIKWTRRMFLLFISMKSALWCCQFPNCHVTNWFIRASLNLQNPFHKIHFLTY